MSTIRRIALAIVGAVLLGTIATGVALWHQGYRLYVIHTGSMVPTYNPGDLVVDGPPSGHYHKGEVLTFLHSALASDVVTHRVVGVTPTGLIHTKGDANRSADVWEIRPNQVKGHTLFVLRNLGYLAVFLKQPAGEGAIATSVLTVVLLWGLFFPPAPPAPSADSSRSDDSDPGRRSRPQAARAVAAGP